jgi:hypothetical protein
MLPVTSACEMAGVAAAAASTKAGTKVLFIMARFLRAHRLFGTAPYCSIRATSKNHLKT